MFSQKKNQTNNTEEMNNEAELKAKLDNELMVRNMPNLKRAKQVMSIPVTSGFSSTGLTSHSGSAAGRSESPHRTIGLVIIGGGLLLIGALVYLSYLFIIKPSLQTPPASLLTSAPIDLATQTAVNTLEIKPEEMSEVEEVNPVILDIEVASTTSSTNEILINEVMAEEGGLVGEEELMPLLDTDSDGLNDEEELVLGTDINKADTNNNTYPDLIEIKNNYNPAGAGTLISNPNLAIYTDSFYDYKIIYPRDWEFSSLSNNQVLIFTTPDGSLMQISIQENFDKEEITSWYLNLFPDNLLTYDKIKMRTTWEGVESPDALNVYLTNNAKSHIYTISYIPAVSDRITYPNIFNMMVESLILP